jgi:hypothetical protein
MGLQIYSFSFSSTLSSLFPSSSFVFQGKALFRRRSNFSISTNNFHLPHGIASTALLICVWVHYFCGISGSHGAEYEEYQLLRCDAVQSSRSPLLLRRNVLLPSSGSKLAETLMWAVSSSETSISLYQATRQNSPNVWACAFQSLECQAKKLYPAFFMVAEQHDLSVFLCVMSRVTIKSIGESISVFETHIVENVYRKNAIHRRLKIYPLWWTKVALGQVFSENFGFSCQSTFQLLLRNHLHYHPRLAQ